MQESTSRIPEMGSARRSDAAGRIAVTHGSAVAAIDALPGTVIDASASINPLGPPDWLRQELERNIAALCHYPDPECVALREAIAQKFGTTAAHVVVGNGSSELLAWLPQVTPAVEWVVPVPSYGEYRRTATLSGRRVVALPLGPAPGFALDWDALERLLDGPKVVVLGHPNNPTGKLLELRQFEGLRRRHPETLFIVDEAFADFCDDFTSTFHPDQTNVLVLRSLTKSLAIAGLRLGYALGSPHLVELLQERLPPWSVNLLAQRVGQRSFAEQPSFATMKALLRPLKTELLQRLSALPHCRVLDTAANWLLLEFVKDDLRAKDIVEACREQGLYLRACDDFTGLDGQWLRVSLRNTAENLRLVDILRRVLGVPPLRPTPPRTRAIMLQGCSSDAGKSLLVTALCRCLAQDGYRVAPFKAQNMSNNSGIACDGGEIGRAQVVQAWAARVAPDTRMNPVLLKPSSDRGAQVVLRGQSIGHHDVLEYLATKQRCLQTALDAYDELARDYDVIVCEGAGSAGEMNLRQNDIVNMGFVEHRDMPVLLVGDIDRGGVYASFVGHLEVMSEADRHRVRGFLVNRFRGDPSLLAEAHRWVDRHTGRPVLGVVPYLKDLALPDEDRLSLESGQRCFGSVDAPLRIAVIAPPHVSNATDFDPLTLEEDVYLYLVERPEELGQPDVLLILGTKNTVGDLEHFRRIGLAAAIVKAHVNGSEVVGICGGLQMLGMTIEDPTGIETQVPHAQGLQLLPVHTRYRESKELRSCRGKHLPSGSEVYGYEIHHGVTDFEAVTPLFVDDAGTVLGGGAPERRVWGSYIHGLFESDGYRHQFLDALRVRRGLPPLGKTRKRYSLEVSFDRLADSFRENVDYAAIRRLLGLP